MKPTQKKLIVYLSYQAKAVEDGAVRTARKASRSSVHDLRVAIRRTRSALWLLKHSSQSLKFKKLEDSLRKLGRELGRARELDVAIRDARDYNIDVSELKKQRRALRRELSPKLGPKRQKRFEVKLKEAYATAQAAADLSFDEALSRLRSELTEWKNKRIYTKTEIHRLRIAVKKARYALEALGRPPKSLMELQDLLGKAHDLKVLEDLTGRRADVRRDEAILETKAIRLMQPALQEAIAHLEMA